MATIYLRLSKKKNGRGRQEILLTFRHGKEIYQRAGTGIFIADNPTFWDGKKMVMHARIKTEEVLYHREQQERLNNLCSAILIAWDDTDHNRVGPRWLKNVIAEFNMPTISQERRRRHRDNADRIQSTDENDVGPKWLKRNDDELEMLFELFDDEEEIHEDTVTSVLVDYIEQLEASESRIKHFWSLWRVFRRFELWNDDTFEFDTFTHNDLENFRDFLLSEHEFWYYNKTTKEMDCHDRLYKEAFYKVNSECKKYGRRIESRCPEQRSKNTLNNILVRLKTYWLWCVRQGYTNNNPFNRFKIDGAKYGTPFYIDINERHKLENTKMEGMVAVQRDIFVFQCCTGCRVSDLYALTYDNIDSNGVLMYTPQKTEKENPRMASVPLVKTALDLIEKYYDPKRGTLFPFISQQKYNVYIKKAFKLANIDRKVAVLNPKTRKNELRPLYEVATSHMARRTFVGIAYQHVKDPNIIAAMTGHAEGSKAFNRYREIDMKVKREVVGFLE